MTNTKKSPIWVAVLFLVALPMCFFLLRLEKTATFYITGPSHPMYPGDSSLISVIAERNSNITLSNNDQNVLHLDEFGRITALAEGHATIVATDGKNTAKLDITVLHKHQLIEKELNITTDNLRHFAAEYPPNLRWETSNSEVAYLNENGDLIASTPGEAQLAAQGGNISYRINVTVTNDLCEGSFIKTSNDDFFLPVGLSSAAPISNVEKNALIWSSSDESIAAINDGVVTAEGPGECMITVSNGLIEYSIPFTSRYTEDSISLELTGHHAFIYDLTDQRLLFTQGKMDDTLYPASLTKLFTAYVALQYLSEDEIVTVGDEIFLIAKDSSTASIPLYSSISVRDLIVAMMVPSGNDAAYIIAAATGRRITENEKLSSKEAITVFMDEVNRCTNLFGFINTNFTQPDGYPKLEHYSCLSDMITITQLAVATPLIPWAANHSSYTAFINNAPRKWRTTVHMMEQSFGYYNPNITGLKTGTSTMSGFCLITSAEYDGHVYLVGTFGCPSESARCSDIQLLLDTFVPAEYNIKENTVPAA